MGANGSQSKRDDRTQTAARPVVTLSLNGADGAIHLPAIKAVFLDAAIDMANFDAVVFTSKQAVIALDRLSGEWKRLKIFSIAAATSRAVSDRGGEVFFESIAASADRLAESIAARYGGLRFLYPRARVVWGDLEERLDRANVVCHSVVLYETAPTKIDENMIPPNAAIIFSAPSVVKSFFAQIAWRSDWRAVALGQSAAETLKKYAPHTISPRSDIKAAIAFAALAA
ncbi:MAG: uroporphyrinogen-III synthase [Helicobacteraceae bacterium]|jgi:uroporphyrinogen-III synthase|nr:uroporphyrinogen-III synthase [Helicobacteraceae bacterium]